MGSKSVEDQQAEATFASAKPKPRLTPEQAARLNQERGLILSRKRVAQQLEAAQNPHHRTMLQAALAELDAQLARLG